MLSAETSALVAGAMRAPAAAAPRVAVRVLRPFMWAGKRVEPGAVLEVERHLASELVNANKAERAVLPPPAASTSTTAAKPAKEKTRAEQ